MKFIYNRKKTSTQNVRLKFAGEIGNSPAKKSDTKEVRLKFTEKSKVHLQ